MGFKTYVTSEKGILPEISLLSMFILPTGKGTFNSDVVIPTTMLLFSHTIFSRMSLAYNLGWQTVANGKAMYTLCMAYGLAKSLGCYLEFYGTRISPHRGTANIAGGFVFVPANNFQLDLSGGWDMEMDYYLNLGASLRIPR